MTRAFLHTALAVTGLGYATPALADGEVQGLIFTSGSGGPVPGVTVQVDGQAQTTTTDADGAFSLTLPAGTWTLRVAGAISGGAPGVVVVDDQTTELLITTEAGAVTTIAMDAPATAVVPTAPTEAATATLVGRVVNDAGAPSRTRRSSCAGPPSRGAPTPTAASRCP